MRGEGRAAGGRRAGQLHVHPATSFPDAAAEWIVSLVQDVIRRRGHCALALTGGSTPRPIYERMARPALATRIAWDLVDVYFGDERCVPPDDAESNYGMARVALLRHDPISRASVHRMEGDRADRDAAARDYARILPERLDVLLLGMGDDGHTASLFPRSPALAEQTRRVLAVEAPATPPWRLTITPPVIHQAHTVLVVVSGAEKASAVARAREGAYEPDGLPIQLALHGTWFVDEPAASGLRGGEP